MGSTTVRMDFGGIDRRFSSGQSARRQELFARDCEELMRPYVPVLEGALRGSAKVSSSFETGEVTYQTPYAARQYYEAQSHTDPNTSDHWDERVDRGLLQERAEAIYGKG